jgi:hypothetical protein
MCATISVVTSGGGTEGAPHAYAAADTSLGESRWPPVVAVLMFMTLNIGLRVWLPREGAIRAPWVLPTIEAVLLVVLLAGDPRGIARRTKTLRRVSLALVGLLLAAALWATALLVYDLIKGSGVTESPTQLLASGALVWLGNNLAFALLYWLIDGGGPTARARQPIPGRLRLHPAHESRDRSAGMAARLPGLPTPRLHQRHRVQPHRRHASDTPREVHDARTVNYRARALRPNRCPCR